MHKRIMGEKLGNSLQRIIGKILSVIIYRFKPKLVHNYKLGTACIA